MHGVSKLTTGENIMLISFQGVQPRFLAGMLNTLADAGVVVDMISQTAPLGGKINVGFTASYRCFDTALKAIGGSGLTRDASPMISGGYSKINLFGEEMVNSVGVAARALRALDEQNIEIAMVTTSDLDISLLVRNEDEDVACAALAAAYGL